MSRPLQTAVAVSASPSVRRQLSRALALAEVELVDMPRDALGARRSLRRYCPELLVTDAQLPLMEGTALARWARGGALTMRPAVLLMWDPCLVLPDRAGLEGAGVALAEKPIDFSAFAAAVEALRAKANRFSSAELARADALLDALGVPDHLGRNCLRAAALLCARDGRLRHHLGAALYPRVGEICGLRASQAERAMRHAIALAWQSDKIENQYRIFADTIDAGRGQPTCGEMISRLADILRLEG